MTMDETIEASLTNYQSLLEWNERYDNKVNTVLTLATAMLGGLGAVTANLKLSASTPVMVWVALAAATLPMAGVLIEISRGTFPDLKVTALLLPWLLVTGIHPNPNSTTTIAAAADAASSSAQAQYGVSEKGRRNHLTRRNATTRYGFTRTIFFSTDPRVHSDQVLWDYCCNVPR